MTLQQQLYARISLGILWIFTGITSTFLVPDIGYEVLAKGSITGNKATTLLYLASGLDVLVGMWVLANWRLKLCCLVQLGIIIGYSILLSSFAPEYWLHPFGPLTKNIPIAVLIYILYLNAAAPGADQYASK